MKRKLLITVLFACIAGFTASAQVKFGVKAGMNLTDLHYSRDKWDNMENQTGFFIGPTSR